ncbi:hypothetical protein BU225_20800 [Stenotrophomonas sp. MB339]|uniref:hypothetical protein n=1 Tax=Stenotrophomonas sp. MB339 TaxID=1663558 RepID=UPI000975EF7C|nr:hypothetical protein [Stenotrophomonas sp. MB339]OMO39120.1 hypothetical protein BU225_20800 [Stenotrophomonas sp. MB339]
MPTCTAVDLSRLPLPAVFEPLQFEQLLELQRLKHGRQRQAGEVNGGTGRHGGIGWERGCSFASRARVVSALAV